MSEGERLPTVDEALAGVEEGRGTTVEIAGDVLYPGGAEAEAMRALDEAAAVLLGVGKGGKRGAVPDGYALATTEVEPSAPGHRRYAVALVAQGEAGNPPAGGGE